MKLLGFEKKSVGGIVRLRGWVESSPRSALEEIYFSFPERFDALVADHADPFVAALLVPAMRRGSPLVIDAPISQRLASGLPKLQEVFAGWYSDALRVVPVHAHSQVGARRAPTAAIGAMFSLGVDSFHTLLRNEEESAPGERITHLIHITGFEAELAVGGDERVHPVTQRIARVAARYGKQLICGETNLRDWFGPGWGRLYHGSALAATALALSNGLDRVLIPSFVSWRDILPWATSPIVDAWWSSDDLAVLHDGADVDRPHKLVDTIVRHAEALNELRVCNKYGGGLGNCGACHKCLRTMLTLEIAGALKGSHAFPRELPRDFWRYFPLKRSGVLFEEANLRLARERGAAPWIISGLERVVRTGKLEALRESEGTSRLALGLLQLAWERSVGDRIQWLRRKRRKRAAAKAGGAP